MKKILGIFTLVALSGCSSSLMVYDSDKALTKGIPVNSSVLMEVTSVTEYKVAKGSDEFEDLCISETSVKLEFYPLGERYYINFDPAEFGDSEFKVEFNDSGLLKHVSLNSKSSGGVEQINSLLSTVLPYVKTPKVVPENKGLVGKGQKASELKAEHCLKSSTKITNVKKVSVK